MVPPVPANQLLRSWVQPCGVQRLLKPPTMATLGQLTACREAAQEDPEKLKGAGWRDCAGWSKGAKRERVVACWPGTAR
jgi:hypothetical protein